VPEDEEDPETVADEEEGLEDGDADTASVELPTNPTPYALVDWPSRALRSPPMR